MARFVRNVTLAGGIPKYVSLSAPPTQGKRGAAEWEIRLDELEAKVSSKAKMLVRKSLRKQKNKTKKANALATC